MAIEWTPWFNVPMHRRLEVLGVTLFMLSLTILGPICGVVILYFLVNLLSAFNSISNSFNHSIRSSIAVLWKYLFENHMRIVCSILVLRLEFQWTWWSWCWVCIFDCSSKYLTKNPKVNFCCCFLCCSVSWVRNWSIWKHFSNYFPVDVIKTADLPNDRNYLICISPHGLLR